MLCGRGTGHTPTLSPCSSAHDSGLPSGSPSGTWKKNALCSHVHRTRAFRPSFIRPAFVGEVCPLGHSRWTRPVPICPPWISGPRTTPGNPGRPRVLGQRTPMTIQDPRTKSSRTRLTGSEVGADLNTVRFTQGRGTCLSWADFNQNKVRHCTSMGVLGSWDLDCI